MTKLKCGILGATGMVGQRFIELLQNHPWFEIEVLAASPRSAGKRFGDLMNGRWAMKSNLPAKVAEMIVLDADGDKEKIVAMVDFVFCAVDLDTQATLDLEEAYAKLECPVVSNNSANRTTKDVPMIVPELNDDHTDLIDVQKQRLGTKRGFIAVKSNCSLQSYVPALYPLKDFGIKRVLVCTYQAISGAGKTFETWPDMVDNVIPFIGGEEEKSQTEPLKIFSTVESGELVKPDNMDFTCQCIRVPASDGHMAAVFAEFEKKPSKDEVLKIWKDYKGAAQKLDLPTAPKQFLNYHTEENFPQTKFHRDEQGGMAIHLGRLREDSQFDFKFIGLSHNTLRGAAGGALLMAELLHAKGFFN